MTASAGTLLGGRVRHEQFSHGHRTGIEPVLLAASVPARSGERVLEGGSGSGAALLCLAARVAGISGLGIELDPALAALAGRNAAANAFSTLGFVAADVSRYQFGNGFDHAMANPPWHDAAGTASPVAAREAAKRAPSGLLSIWATSLARPLRHRGSMTFVIAATSVPECLAAFAAAGCGSMALVPLWPRPSVAAKLVLLQGVKGGRGPFRILPGLVLHAPDGTFSREAAAVLRDGAAIDWA